MLKRHLASLTSKQKHTNCFIFWISKAATYFWLCRVTHSYKIFCLCCPTNKAVCFLFHSFGAFLWRKGEWAVQARPEGQRYYHPISLFCDDLFEWFSLPHIALDSLSLSPQGGIFLVMCYYWLVLWRTVVWFSLWPRCTSFLFYSSCLPDFINSLKQKAAFKISTNYLVCVFGF